MSFSLETRINGQLIGFAYGVNKGLQSNSKDLYEIEYHRITKEPSIIKFNILHNPEEGIEKLSSLIYNKINQELKNGNKNF